MGSVVPGRLDTNERENGYPQPWWLGRKEVLGKGSRRTLFVEETIYVKLHACEIPLISMKFEMEYQVKDPELKMAL